MSWITELAKVYDNTILWENDDKPTPVYHTTNNATVTITIDGNGKFIKAERVEKDKKSFDHVTIMPCTESCAARTSGADAYPLCDKLEYVSGDSQKYSLYLNLLKSWAESEFATNKIKAVFKYVSTNSLLTDLKNAGISESDVSDFIRWKVEVSGDTQPELWKDETAYKSWIDFYNSDSFEEYVRNNFSKKDYGKYIRRNDLNYVDGKITKIASYHPAKIRNAGSSAKIISSNDTSNYTFRGRFLTDAEACQISSEATQKAHSALRWLLKRQSASVGESLSVVTWNSACRDLPQITSASTDLLPVVSVDTSDKKTDNGMLEFDFGFDESEDKAEPQGIYQTSKEFADAMKNRLLGYYGDISNPQNIMVMALKEATPGQGRVSIILYRELQNSDMFYALNKWHNRLSWYITYWEKGKKTPVHTIGTPSPKTIAECAYGEQVKPQLVEKTVQRLLPCILDGGLIPADLETQCVKSASNLLVVENYKRDMVLETACAVYKYNRIIRDEEDYELALEENRTSRDYLYGRLLAIADKLESVALYNRAKRDGSDTKKLRETNAIRYMQAFSVRPFATWNCLSLKILPYMKEVSSFYSEMITSVTSMFNHDDFVSNTPLSGEYLLGYHCQLMAFKNYKNTDDSSDENTED